jgi:hypothetical protein
MTIHEFDVVILNDGREAAIVEVFDGSHFLADVSNGPDDWDTITIDQIETITYHSK